MLFNIRRNFGYFFKRVDLNHSLKKITKSRLIKYFQIIQIPFRLSAFL